MRFLNVLKKFNNLKIQNKLIISYIIVVFLPVLQVGLILTENMKHMAMERAINETSVNLDRLINRINEITKIPMDIWNRTALDSKFQNMMNKQYTTTLDVVNAYSEYTNFDSYLYLYREIEDITFYSYNQTILDSGQFLRITKDISDLPWFQEVIKDDKQMYWQYVYNKYKNDNLLYLTNCIKDTSGKTIGVLTIGVTRTYLYSILKNEPYNIIILSDYDYIIASKDLKLVGKNINEAGLSFFDNMDIGINETYYKNERSKIIIKAFKPSVNNGEFKAISLFPVRHIEEEIIKVRKLGMLIMAASLLFAFVFILIFSNAISKRLRRLSEYVNKVAKGNFHFVPVIEGDDEIGHLSNNLNTMVKSINELVHEVYEANLQKKQLTIYQNEIKLKMLANQINPHFLFNVLETIRMKAHCNGEHELAEITKMLGKLMRRNLEVENKLVSLESEIGMVKNYMEIQRFRYGSRITYDIIYDFDINHFKVLPLLIQPIIENCFVHGLENKPGSGNVNIRLMLEANAINIVIKDNGIGMSPEKLKYVLNSLDDTQDVPGKRIGIKNVYQRIRLFYGDKYGLTIHSIENEGTEVRIILPGSD